MVNHIVKHAKQHLFLAGSDCLYDKPVVVRKEEKRPRCSTGILACFENTSPVLIHVQAVFKVLACDPVQRSDFFKLIVLMAHYLSFDVQVFDDFLVLEKGGVAFII